jgi:Uma2 family endonuclease
MSTDISVPTQRRNDYPTSDGRPMGETDLHRKLMASLIELLENWFARDPMVYVSGNLLVFYEPGNRRRHLSPDVFVVKGVPNHIRDNYLIWEEGRGPDVVIELTSASTRTEDVDEKMGLYRDVLRVPEYFLFDPRGEYLEPDFQGYRLSGSDYVAIEAVANRLPSECLGLHLERRGQGLRLFDPATGQYLPSQEEQTQRETAARVAAEQARQQAEQARQQAEQARQQEAQMRQQAEQARRQEEEARQQAEQARQQAEQARQQAEAELERLRRELEELKRLQPPAS